MIVSFTLPRKDNKKLMDCYPEWVDKEIKCRLVKVKLDTGETEILYSSLIDMEAYPYEEFNGLYHFRRDEEEGYKLLENRIEL